MAFVKFVEVLSHYMEVNVKASVKPEDVGTPAVPGVKRKLKKAGKLAAARKIAEKISIARSHKRLCMKYWRCGRKVFHGSKHLALAADFSRVSRRGCGVGFVANQENHGMWAPPQVTKYTWNAFLCGPEKRSPEAKNRRDKNIVCKIYKSVCKIYKSVCKTFFATVSGFKRCTRPCRPRQKHKFITTPYLQTTFRKFILRFLSH